MPPRILVVDDSPTVRRIVQRTLERAGHEVRVAADGREALEQAQQQVPELVLLDFVMPHMNGFQFCQAMRGVANLRDVPVVLMSAKADRIGDQFLEQTGAVDAISKPFGPEALLAVTTNALSRRDRAAVTDVGTTLAPDLPETEGDGGDQPTPVVPWNGLDEAAGADADKQRHDAARSAAKRLATTLGPVVRQLTGADEPTDDRLALSIASSLAHEELFALADDLHRELPGESGEVSFEGRAEHVPLGELLQLLQHQQQTGVLTVERRGGEGQPSRSISVFMRQGLVDFALGRGGDDGLKLGRFLLEEELVEREDLDLLLKRRGGDKRLLGAQLVKLGYISPEDLKHALVRQTSELVYETLRWRTGHYRFERFATRPEAAEARLGLPVASILMEGLRRVDEWRLIEEQIHDFDMVLDVRRDAVDALDAEALSQEERHVLSSVDGQRSVRQIVERGRMSSFDTCKILFQLMTSGLVREAA